MKAMTVSSSSIPCKKNITLIDEKQMFEGRDLYYLSSEVIIRKQPDGAIIIPERFIDSALFVDIELLEFLCRDEVFKIDSINRYSANMLIDNGVLIKGDKCAGTPKIFSVNYVSLPYRAFIDVTSFCSCTCDTCYRGDDINNYSPQLKEIFSWIDKSIELGVVVFEILGGEPTIRNDLLAILTYLRYRGARYYVDTNTEYIDLENQALIFELSFSQGVIVHLDGIGTTHDDICKRSGLFSIMEKNIKFLIDSGVNVYFTCTLQDLNISEVDKIVNFAHKYGTTVHLRPFINSGRAKGLTLNRSSYLEVANNYVGHPSVFIRNTNTDEIVESYHFGCPSYFESICINQYGSINGCVMDREGFCSSVLNIDRRILSTISAYNEQCNKSIVPCTSCESLFFDRCGGLCQFSRQYKAGRMQTVEDISKDVDEVD